MTVDNDNSIYVGNIPYDCTEDDIRKVFDLFGSIIAVKTIGGRVVNVNEVHARRAGAGNYMYGSDSGFGNQGYNDNGRTCYICKSHGHFYRECPELDSEDDNGESSGDSDSDGGGPGIGACYICGESGHFARECYKQGINPTPAEAATLLRQADNSMKEIVVTAPQVMGSNDGRMRPINAKIVTLPTVRSVNPKLEETSDKVPLQVDSGEMAGPEGGSGKNADAEVPPQVGSAKKAGPAVTGIFSDEDSEDMVLKMENTSIIKGFPVPNEYAALYNMIYEKHGHIATKAVIRHSMTALFGLVVDLLVVLTEMKETSHGDLTVPLLEHWMSKISTAEAVKFNVGWLRTIIEEIDKYHVAYKVLHLVVESDAEEELKKTQEEFVAATESKEALKVQLLAAEKHAAEVEKKLNESQILVKRQLEAKERLIAHQRQSVLTGLL
ncbi:hypothetical protein MKW94_009301 [Papaver nudicaule]|uniref:Uncharacterized protein n=1 Tax=Papaver nudicaule TaxID=74823 RepID=A0AA41VY05_PAPNU|nr:hypothetical protein [Papaver nudicaule]